MHFEEILEEIGSFGTYQRVLCFGLIPFTTGLVGLTYYSQLLILATPPHTCIQGSPAGEGGGAGVDHQRLSELLNSTPYSEEARQPYSCHQYGPNVTWSDPTLTLNVTSLDQLPAPTLPCENGWVYDYEVLFSTYTSEHDWVCGEAWKPYLVVTIFWVGNTVGSWVWGIISDIYGRRVGVVGSIVVYGAAGVASVFVHNFYGFAILRFLAGSSHHTVTHLSFVLVVEYCGLGSRVIPLLTIMVTYTLASLAAPALAWLMWSWPALTLLSAIPCLFLPLATRWLPESASWLITRGRGEEARRQLERVARVNGRQLPKDMLARLLAESGSQEATVGGVKNHQDYQEEDEVEKEVQDNVEVSMEVQNKNGVKERVEDENRVQEEEAQEEKVKEGYQEEDGVKEQVEEKHAVNGVLELDEVKRCQEVTIKKGDLEVREEGEDREFKLEGNSKRSAQSIVEVVKYPGLLKNILLVLVVWMLSCMCYYGHCQNTANLGNSILVSYLLGALVEVPSWCAPYVIHKCGRRMPLAIVLLASSVAGFLYAVIPEELEWLVLTVGLVGRSTITGAYYISLQYGPEIFPTVVRGQGVALAETLGGIAIFISPLIVYMGEHERTAPLLVFAGLSTVAGAATLMLPETGGIVLPQTLLQAEKFARNATPLCCRSKSTKTDPEDNNSIVESGC